MVSFLIALVILLGSHLSVDRDFPESVKTTSSVVFGIIALLYLIFGLIL